MADRTVELVTALGKGKTHFHGMHGAEGLSIPFSFDIEFLSENASLDAKQVLGKPANVKMLLPDDKGHRFFHGVVASFKQTGTSDQGDDLFGYRINLRPSLWFLDHHADCRIFQEKTVPQIIDQVLADQGISDVERQLNSSYRTRTYCVQYRESDFDFISRLMEEEGIYYYFKHEEGRHVLVISDGYSSHATQSGYEKLPYYPPDQQRRQGIEYIDAWSTISEVKTTEVKLDDYDFEGPKKDLSSKNQHKTPHSWPTSKYDVFDYPGEYLDTGDGDHYARVRREQFTADYERMSGTTNARGLLSGRLFTLTEYPRSDLNQEYLIVSVRHEIAPEEYRSGGGSDFFYEAGFEVLNSKVPFRAPMVTPRPKIVGPQTAVVVGKKGEEIWTDKYGRVKCQFHWDREGKNDENSSCWIRVAQIGWAGKRWGGHHVPRIGHEVIVEFLEGDPDQPIVTGRVYNGDNMPPYGLPGEQTKSGIKSNSSKGGGGFNEIRFEDKKGSEEIYVHAEKDANRIVQDNDTLKVGFEKKNKGDQTIEIFNNQDLTVGCGEASDGSQTIRIWKDRTTTIETGNEKLQISKGDRTVLVDLGDDTLKIAAGNHTIKVAAGKSLTQAAQSITLKVAGSSIVIDPKGITMKGPVITIQGQAKVDIKGAMTQLAASAINIIKGALVKIN